VACPVISPPTSGVVELDRDDKVVGFCVGDDEDAAAAIVEDIVDIVVKGMSMVDDTGIQVTVVASVLAVENEGTAVLGEDPILDGASSKVNG